VYTVYINCSPRNSVSFNDPAIKNIWRVKANFALTLQLFFMVGSLKFAELRGLQSTVTHYKLISTIIIIRPTLRGQYTPPGVSTGLGGPVVVPYGGPPTEIAL
jgi:hypothetical protein